jgi:hypothetical protein
MTIFSCTTTTQQSNCVKLQEAVGCIREQEAEAPADARQWGDRWRSHRWTRAEALDNKRGGVTRDDVTTNQTKLARRVEDGRQEIEAKAPTDYRRQRNKRRRGWRSIGAGDREQEAKGQAEVRERLAVKRRMQRRSRGQEVAVQQESEASGIS